MADDFGQTPATAGTLLVNNFVNGVINVAGDRDWFGVQLLAGHTYVFNDLGAPSQTGTLPDPLLRLYNSAGVLIPTAVNDDSGLGFEAQLVVRPTVSAIYYIEAAAFADVGTGSYRVSVADNGTENFRFQTATLGLAGFGTNASAGGWGDFNTFPRDLGGYNNAANQFGSVGNADDAADIVGFGAAGTFVSRATGLGQFGPAALATAAFGTNPAAGGWDTQNHYPRELGDADGNGRTDIIAFGEAGTFVALGQADGSFGAAFQASTGFGAGLAAGGWTDNDLFHREVADVNGDFRSDIIGFGAAGVFVALGQAGGTFGPTFTASNQFGSNAAAGGWTSQNIFPRFIADVNADFRGDIVAFGAAGVFVALAQPGGTFGPAFQASTGFGVNAAAGGWENQQLFTRLVGDINSDFRADIVGFGAAGTFFALGQPGGTFGATTFGIAAFGTNPEVGGWTDNNVFGRAIADVTGDFRADIVGFGANGVFVSQSLDPLVI